MQQAYQGVISTVNSKPFTDNRTGQPITLHSFQLEGVSQWFRTGTAPIPFGRGQSVKFVADGPKVDVSTMQAIQSTVSTAPAPVPTARTYGNPSQSGGKYKANNASKDEYWANKEARDLEKDKRFQEVSEPRMALSTATGAAAQIVVAALQNDAIGFGNTAKSKRLGMLADYVKEVAVDLATFIHNAPSVLADAESRVPYGTQETQDEVEE